jgi:hypothetical protein
MVVGSQDFYWRGSIARPLKHHILCLAYHGTSRTGFKADEGMLKMERCVTSPAAFISSPAEIMDFGCSLRSLVIVETFFSLAKRLLEGSKSPPCRSRPQREKP